jgi:ribosome-binding factor A
MEMSLLIDQANATRAADAEPDPVPASPESPDAP